MMTKMKLKVDIESKQEPGYTHPAGSQGIIVEQLGENAWLIEVRVPDETLVGDAWYETIEVYEREFEKVI